MEPLKAPINLVSEEEAKAWRPSPRLLLWGLGAPTKALGGEVTVLQAPRGSLIFIFSINITKENA